MTNLLLAIWRELLQKNVMELEIIFSVATAPFVASDVSDGYMTDPARIIPFVSQIMVIILVLIEFRFSN